jgi:hypothetical protein
MVTSITSAEMTTPTTSPAFTTLPTMATTVNHDYLDKVTPGYDSYNHT